VFGSFVFHQDVVMFCGEIDLGRNHIKEADFIGRMKTYKHLINGEMK
jgi:hypothetical protein